MKETAMDAGLPTDGDMNATEVLVKVKGIPRAQAIALNGRSRRAPPRWSVDQR
jgi:hypothetical protein